TLAAAEAGRRGPGHSAARWLPSARSSARRIFRRSGCRLRSGARRPAARQPASSRSGHSGQGLPGGVTLEHDLSVKPPLVDLTGFDRSPHGQPDPLLHLRSHSILLDQVGGFLGVFDVATIVQLEAVVSGMDAEYLEGVVVQLELVPESAGNPAEAVWNRQLDGEAAGPQTFQPVIVAD